jgi:ATP synthase protein I
MSILAPDTENEEEASSFTPLTAEQAQALRKLNPSISPWWVVAGQILVGVLVTLASWGVTGKPTFAWSTGFGALAVVLPSAIFARGVTGRFAAASIGNSLMSLFVWEMVKIVMTVAVMFAAHRMVVNLSWPAMLVGLVVTMKVYWVVLRFGSKAAPIQNVTLNGKSN